MEKLIIRWREELARMLKAGEINLPEAREGMAVLDELEERPMKKAA